MLSTRLNVVALACAALTTTMLLTACGGGSDEKDAGAQPSGQGWGTWGGTTKSSSIAPTTSSDTIIVVYLPWGSAGNTVAFKTTGGKAVYLYKNDGTTKITSLDDLPIGLANHAWTKNASAAGHLRVRFDPGTYRLKTGWLWPAEASGHAADHQIVLEQTPGSTGEVALLGSDAASATYSATTGRVSLNIADKRPFEQLWAENGRAIRARQPNVGSYFYVRAGAQGWPASATDPTVVGTLNGAPVANQAFQADATGYQALSALKAANDPNAVVVLMDSWQVSKHRLAEVDSNGQRARLTPASYWALGAAGPGQRYFIENTLSALDAPGEWYWTAGSSSSTLYYKPASTQSGAKVNFEIPRVDRLLRIQGAGDSGKWAQFIQFSKLKFRYAKADMPSAGYIDGQADTGVSAAIELNDARNIEFDSCEVSHTGGYGIWLNGRVRSVTVNASELYDLGAGGIKVGKSRPAVVTQADWDDVANPASTGAVTISGNRIHSLGHVYPGAVGVWIGRSSGNKVADNLIKDTTYSGISVGWTWDAGATMASGNTIQNNFLYNIGQRALADMGGIYLLGRAPGTLVSGNVIKEVRSFDGYTWGGNGIYADEGSSQLNVSGNIVLGVDGNGFSLHYGEDNTISGNAFANTAKVFAIGKRLAGSSAVPAIFRDNRLLPTSNDMIGRSQDSSLMSGADTGTPSWVAPAPVLGGNTISAQYLPANTAPAVPSLCTGCAITTTGLNVADTGALKVPKVSDMSLTEGVNVARSWDTAPLSTTVSAARLWAGKGQDVPARVIDFRASQWPLNTTNLVGWQVIAQAGKTTDPNDANILPVSIQKDTDGTQFLALADAPRDSYQWEPYIQSWLSYASGTAKVSFTARFDAGTNLSHVWRSDDAGTTVGPSVSFVANGGSVNVIVNGQTLTTVPVGAWVGFEVISPIAAKSSWTLNVTKNGQATSYTGLAQGHATWSYLGPVLFISGANVKTTTAIKAINISKL